jgi:hypothetical protein
MKEYECGKKCLSPSIFRSKGPVVLASSSASTSANTDFTVKGIQSLTFKKPEGINVANKDLSL